MEEHMKWLGFGLALLGTALLYGGLDYNHRTTILEVGGMTATATEHRPMPFAPLAGGVVMVAGFALLLVPRRRMA
jgi:hypothetical protein